MTCRTQNCESKPMRDGEFCWRCWEELNGEYVTMRSVLAETFKGLFSRKSLVTVMEAIGDWALLTMYFYLVISWGAAK